MVSYPNPDYERDLTERLWCSHTRAHQSNLVPSRIVESMLSALLSFFHTLSFKGVESLKHYSCQVNKLVCCRFLFPVCLNLVTVFFLSCQVLSCLECWLLLP